MSQQGESLMDQAVVPGRDQYDCRMMLPVGFGLLVDDFIIPILKSQPAFGVGVEWKADTLVTPMFASDFEERL